MKTCPACAEQIQDQAIRCPHCRTNLVRCPYCAEWIPAGATACQFCGEMLVQAPVAPELPQLFELEVQTPLGVVGGIVYALIISGLMVACGVGAILIDSEMELTGGVCGFLGILPIGLAVLLVGAVIWSSVKSVNHDYVKCLHCEKGFWLEKASAEAKCPGCARRGTVVLKGARQR